MTTARHNPRVRSTGWLGGLVLVLFALCVFDGVGWAYGIKYPRPIFPVTPIREEPCSVRIVASVGITNEAKERDTLFPSHNTCNLSLIEGDFHLPLMFPVGGQDKFCKDIRLFMGGLLVRDGKVGYGPTDIYPCQEGRASTDIGSEPFEPKLKSVHTNLWPPLRVVWNNHNPRPLMLKRELGLVRYALPLPPSKVGIDRGGGKRKEVCNNGKGFIAGHWILGAIFCAVGIYFGAQSYRRVIPEPSLGCFARFMAYQFLFAIFFGIGMYGILSTTFKDCNLTPNAAGERRGVGAFRGSIGGLFSQRQTLTHIASLDRINDDLDNPYKDERYRNPEDPIIRRGLTAMIGGIAFYLGSIWCGIQIERRRKVLGWSVLCFLFLFLVASWLLYWAALFPWTWGWIW